MLQPKKTKRFVDLVIWIIYDIYQVLPSAPFGGFKWPFQGLSDLHLGDQEVTWKKLVYICDTHKPPTL